jgi:hypothetical protein
LLGSTWTVMVVIPLRMADRASSEKEACRESWPRRTRQAF